VPQRHHPVLLPEVIAHLAPADGERYIDGTFGAGGYTRAILEAAECHVWALDRDSSAIEGGRALIEAFGPRLDLACMPFGNLLLRLVQDPGMAGSFDGFVLDLGVSSMQIDEASRGFSFQKDGPLDMRMSAAPGVRQSEAGPSAADVVNSADQSEIADILYQLGEERRSRHIAAAIVKRRKERPFERTLDLADLVVSVIGRHAGDKVHPATRTFQALRIFVNDELGELFRGLSAAERLLKPGGRLVVVTFHSLEDRMVKQFLAARAGKGGRVSRHLPPIDSIRVASFRIVNSRPATPSEEEIRRNPRARSAKLRAAVRTDSEPWPIDGSEALVPAILRS
jgi:16S rRNA (cytosine1402-N4)-methyltransferase